MYKSFTVSDFPDFEELLDDQIIENESYDVPARQIVEEYGELFACPQYKLKRGKVEVVQDQDDPVDPDSYVVLLNGVPAGHVRREDREELLDLLKSKDAELGAVLIGGPEKRVIEDAYGPLVEETDGSPLDLCFSVRTPENAAQSFAAAPIHAEPAPPEKGSAAPKLGVALLATLMLSLAAGVALLWLEPTHTMIYAIGVAVCAVAAWIANNKI